MENEPAILAMAALAQSTRVAAFKILVNHEPDGLPAGELARVLAHLSVLSRADLVTSERRSRTIVYRANLQTFQSVALFLLQDCCGGRPDICAPVLNSLKICDTPKSKKEKSRA